MFQLAPTIICPPTPATRWLVPTPATHNAFAQALQPSLFTCQLIFNRKGDFTRFRQLNYPRLQVIAAIEFRLKRFERMICLIHYHR